MGFGSMHLNQLRVLLSLSQKLRYLTKIRYTSRGPTRSCSGYTSFPLVSSSLQFSLSFLQLFNFPPFYVSFSHSHSPITFFICSQSSALFNFFVYTFFRLFCKPGPFFGFVKRPILCIHDSRFQILVSRNSACDRPCILTEETHTASYDFEEPVLLQTINFCLSYKLRKLV